MGRVVHFEIPVEDGDRAREFYGRAFGWQIEGGGEESYWLATTGDERTPGIDGALIGGSDLHPHPVVVIGVDSIDDSLERAREAGATVLMGKHTIPSIGYSAYLRDPEGNVLGLFEPEPAPATDG